MFFLLIVVPVGVSATAVLLRRRASVAYWVMAATLALGLPFMLALPVNGALAATWQGRLVTRIAVLLPPIVTVFSIVRTKWMLRPASLALSLSAITFVGVVLFALAVGANLGLVPK